MAVDKEQVKQLLGTGLSNEIVASAVGCDPAYISQLMSDPVFSEQVVALRTAALMDASKQDRNIAGIEAKLTTKINEAVDNGLIYKPNDLLRAFAVLNAAKRRGVPVTDSPQQKAAVVALQIPVKVIQNLVINKAGEVVEADGQTLVTMPTQQLLRNLSAGEGSKDGKSAEKYQRVAQFLPGQQIEAVRHD